MTLRHASIRRSICTSSSPGNHEGLLGNVAAMDTLEVVKCPNLILLAIHLGTGTTALQLLALALATGRMPFLEKLHVECEGTPVHAADYGVKTILKAISDARSTIHLEDIKITGQPATKPTTGRVKWPAWLSKWW